jgi:hypothetical protein
MQELDGESTMNFQRLMDSKHLTLNNEYCEPIENIDEQVDTEPAEPIKGDKLVN